jgi:hypothetical protein
MKLFCAECLTVRIRMKRGGVHAHLLLGERLAVGRLQRARMFLTWDEALEADGLSD